MFRTVLGVVFITAVAVSAQPPKKKGEARPPEGWSELVSEAKDFAVHLPGEASENEIPSTNQKMRAVSATKGEARFSVFVYTDRKGDAQKEDYLKVVPNDIDVVKGSLKKKPLGALDGLEYQKKEPDGTISTYRVYRSKDGKTAVTLVIFKGAGLKQEERAAFLDSFRFLDAKKK